jgi:molybdenum cofactor cytidylyltransferase
LSVAAILLAAGASRRMRGRDKLLEPVRGVPLLRDRAQMLLDAGCFDQVIAVLPVDRPARNATLEGLALTCVANPNAARGMGSSVVAGAGALTDMIEHAMILPADMPDLVASDIQTLVGARMPRKIIRAATEEGLAGSPVLFSQAFFGQLRALRDDQTGRDVLRAHPEAVTLVPLPGNRARLDLDTPEAWAAWRKTQS